MAEKFFEKFTAPKKQVKKNKAKKEFSENKENQASRKDKPKTSAKAKQNPKPLAIQRLFNTSNLSKADSNILENFDTVIQGVRPLNSKQLLQLPENIRALSHQLTDQRSERRLGYMNDNVQLSSYIRYYTWWNLVRLTRLFSNLPPEAFPASSQVCLDLGTGPLTVITALWLARPELRNLNLTWYCLDVSANSMALGEDVFLSVAAKTTAEELKWKIIRVKGSFGTSIKQKAGFITCANMFNELDQAGDMPPEYQTKKYYEQLKVYSAPDAKLILIEPGVPKAARTISLLRERFIRDDFKILAPCPHSEECPMNGFKAYTGSQNKWCNFAFSTEDAPEKLQKLSEQAKLPKERATLSFIAVSKNADSQAKAASESDGSALPKTDLLCRVASDPFRLPEHSTGFYACSKYGLTLLKLKNQMIQNKETQNPKIENAVVQSGDLISVKTKTPDSLPKDQKSGAVVISI